MTTISLHANHPNKVTIHSLPCKIKHTGPAKVSDYFIETELEAKLPNDCGIDGSIVDNKLQQKKYSYNETNAYFRGRALLKNVMKFDEGICGYQLNQADTGNDTDKVWETKSVFKHINIWKLTNKQREKYENTINNWYKISAAIHGPIEKSIHTSPNANTNNDKD
eukprot:220425_1